MLVSETPSATQGDQMHQLIQAQRLAAILRGHQCVIAQLASGSETYMTFRCAICGSEEPISSALKIEQWLFQRARQRQLQLELEAI